MAWAINRESKLNVMFVVGMAGLGKTLVAKKVYEGTKKKFHCCAWIPISKSQKKEELLWTTLKQLCESLHKPIPQDFCTISIKELTDQLRTLLQHRKYLIIFDDLWSKDVWESLKYAFPNQTHGRVIITTRRGDIAELFRQEYISVYYLQPLSTEMAQQLFYKRTFPSTGECPPGLLEWSRKFLKQCEGLPLGIISIGNLLSNMEKTTHAWRKLHDSLGSEFGSNGRLSSTMDVISASYDELPYSLKYCLLYFSIFPEDYWVERRKLIRLWISEGLVIEVMGKTPEDVGEDYLKELIQRSLVLVKDDFDGRPKNCRVHNLLRKIISIKSQEENFCTVFTDHGPCLNEKVRRLSIHQLSSTNKLQMKFAHSRSFFMIGVGELPHSTSHQAILSSFSILKVLDLEGAPLDKFPTAIVNLILLRHLSLRNTNIRRIPSSISKLQNLEVLDLKQTFVTELPRKIINLIKLRHLLVYRYNLKNYVSIDCVQGFKGFNGIGRLKKLQKLSFIKANRDYGMLGKLENLLELRKLGVIGLKEQDGRYLCHSIMKLKNLQSLDLASIHEDEILDLTAILDPPTLLQRLYLKGRLQNLPNWMSSLHDLIRIRLKWSKLDISPIDALQDLPNLMELQLLDAFTGKQLDFRLKKFPNLKILELEKMENLEQVIMEKGTLAKLEKLIIRKCEKMKVVPKGIERLALLRELHFCDMEDIQINGRLVKHIPFIYSYTLDSSGHWSSRNLSS